MKIFKPIFLLSLLFIHTTSYSQEMVDKCIDILTNRRVRPNPGMLGTLDLRYPRQVVAALNREMSFTRHHIIPYSVLFDFFKRILLRNEFRTTFLERVNQYVEILWNVVFDVSRDNQLFVQRPPPEIAAELSRNNLIYRIIQSSPRSILELRNRLGNHQTSMIEVSRMVQAFFLWLPGNIMIGPTRRSDDPGDGFEVRSFHIIGLRNYRVLDNLYHQLLSFNSLPEGDVNENLFLNQIITGLQTVMRRTYGYPYDPNQWRQTNVNSDGQPVYEINVSIQATEDVVDFISHPDGSVSKNHHIRKRSIETQLDKPSLRNNTSSYNVALDYQLCFNIIFNYAQECIQNDGFLLLDKLSLSELG